MKSTGGFCTKVSIDLSVVLGSPWLPWQTGLGAPRLCNLSSLQPLPSLSWHISCDFFVPVEGPQGLQEAECSGGGRRTLVHVGCQRMSERGVGSLQRNGILRGAGTVHTRISFKINSLCSFSFFFPIYQMHLVCVMGILSAKFYF